MSQPIREAEIGQACEEGYVWDGSEWIDAEALENIKQCDHDCTSECRRSGCNCACGEYHNPELVAALNK